SRALPADLHDHLCDAADLARRRFREPEHSAYDGLLRDPAVVAELHQIFGPDRILSPTALENYIACPFRFFLDNLLRLEPLEEPSEEIESTDRGLAFHRALARLHTHLHGVGVHLPTEAVDAEVNHHLERAVHESAGRGSPASEVLWRLEGERLKRHGARYRRHWQRFIDPWLERKVQPQPAYFEVG